MSILEAIILGIIQGLTEFLPVSSSGHIELGKFLFGLNDNDVISIVCNDMLLTRSFNFTGKFAYINNSFFILPSNSNANFNNVTGLQLNACVSSQEIYRHDVSKFLSSSFLSKLNVESIESKVYNAVDIVEGMIEFDDDVKNRIIKDYHSELRISEILSQGNNAKTVYYS